MKLLLHRLFSLLLCLILLLSKLVAGDLESGEIVAPPEPEPPQMKAFQVVFSQGCWLEEYPFFDGVTDGTQDYFSTQKFTPEVLPTDSVITVAPGARCQLFRWGEETVSFEELPEQKLVITEAFWTGASSCAFNLKFEGEVKPENLSRLFTISVPVESRDRRDYSWNEDHSLSILMVGNSFSIDALEYVWEIARSAGIENVRLGNLVYPACRIDRHFAYWANEIYDYAYWQNTDGVWDKSNGVSYLAAFENSDWDFISFQQSAMTVQTDEEGYQCLGELISMAQELSPDARIVYHMPWPNPHPNYNDSTETMYRDCMTAARRIIEACPQIEEVVCTGTAIQNVRTSFISNDDIVRDGWHLSFGMGRYTAGLAFFTQLTGISVEDIDYAPDSVSDAYKTVAIEAAVHSLECPRLVIQSAYTTRPGEATESLHGD